MDQPNESNKPAIFQVQGEPPAAPPDESATTATQPRDLTNDLMSVLLTASKPMTLLAIQDELNAPGRGDHVPTGPIDRALDDMTGGDRPRVVVVKLGDPVVEHYMLSHAYRAEVESPGLVVEKRAAILGAIFAPDGLGEDDEERDEGDGFPISEIVEILEGADVIEVNEDLSPHIAALVDAGLIVTMKVNPTSETVYVLAKGVPGRLLAEGAPALAKTTIPPKEAPPSDSAVAAQAEEDRKTIESYIARLTERHDEQERRALHFQGEAHKFAQRSAKYEQWARRGGFNIAEITGQVDASARGQGVPWVVLRIVDERELRRLLTEEDKLNESLTASKKSFESAKRAYEATKSQLEEKLALVKQAQRSTSYAPEKMVRRIVRDLMVEVVSDDAHDYGMHLDWEELREEDKEEEPEVVVPEPPAKVAPAGTVAIGGKLFEPAVAIAGAGIATADMRDQSAPTTQVVQVSRREDGTTSTFAGSVPGPVAPADDRRIPEGKQYAGKLDVKEMADPMTAIFLNEEFGLRRSDVQAHFEAAHGALPEGGAKIIEPTLRFLEGRGSLLSGDVPGAMPTSDPVKLYWHSSFKDPRTAPPPAPLEPAPKPARKTKEKAVKAPAADDAPKDKAKTKEPAKASKRAKKAASK